MSWLISAKQYIPAVIGEAWGGGYFAGYISHTADGNPTHALIVAPGATGATGTGYTLTTNLQWKTAQTATSATSTFDGKANTDAIIAAGIANHPATEFCVSLGIGGYSDWYLPAPLELAIAYVNLKPTTGTNNTSHGINAYAVPPKAANYSASDPSQTGLSLFQSGGAQAFQATAHWSSRQNIASSAEFVLFSTGQLNAGLKTNTQSVRAFRRIAL